MCRGSAREMRGCCFAILDLAYLSRTIFSFWSILVAPAVLVQKNGRVLLLMKEEFLSRSETLSRAELDGKQQKAFWVKVAEKFNSTDDELDTLYGDSVFAARYAFLGLCSKPTGYVATAAKCEEGFKDMRTEYSKAEARFLESGMGDNGISIIEQADPNYAVTMYSSSFKDFVSTAPILEFFYDVLIKNDMLASAAVDMPAEAKSGSSSKHGKKTAQMITRRTSGGGSLSYSKTGPDVFALELSPESKAMEKKARADVALSAKMKAKRQKFAYENEIVISIRDKKSALRN